jgi:transcriptional regulator with XRE-family HTH domain
MITPEQSRAARGLLGWTQQDLANKAGIGIVTVHQLEARTSQPRRATLDVIRRGMPGTRMIGGGRPAILPAAEVTGTSKRQPEYRVLYC